MTAIRNTNENAFMMKIAAGDTSFALDKNTMKRIKDFVAAHPDDVSTPAPTVEKCVKIILDLMWGWYEMTTAIARRDWKSEDRITFWMEAVEASFHDYKNYCVPIGEAPDNDLLGFWKSFADFRYHFLLNSFNTDFDEVDRDAWLTERLQALTKEMADITAVLHAIIVT